VPTPFPEPKAGYEQRAAVLFNKLGCLGCHGPDGKGTFDANRKNDNGTVAYPRDFTAQIFKGGGEPEHLYRRIYLGIPGTPMKAFGKEATPDEIVDLVYYVKHEKFKEFPPAGATAGKP
jgi:mono/diheme cytochrome c family protein